MPEKQLDTWLDFGAEVRRRRTQAGKSLGQVAKELSITSGMLGKIERATRATKKDIAQQLEDYFGTNGILLRKWEHAATGSPEWFRLVTKSEENATEIRAWAPILVPGVLQVEGYARAIFKVGRPLDRPDEIERLVAARLERGRTLTREDGPRLWVTLCESVLGRIVGGTDIMRDQLALLVELAEKERIRVQVVPATTPDCPGNSGPFRIITTREGGTIVYGDSSGGGNIVDSLPEVRRHVALYGELQAVALPPTTSLNVIRKAQGAI
ncbi:Predicted transcriptional regulator [Marinactinospora thermotolerans DSM 45154]|uniref:Predicted transcriptional regulator n=1 Tax=Marinactinospora thermotolerans DSM 45154 TaxID=1122192 RepID=A0A1T4TJ28_9ACTN|nr:helix-turn-helix transcriptional regulator [Marinactinospora thermotolerans]SKA40271.1 Predicted transcriptional regulator [Marinactinospora thermotolerans DSM 45154]